MSTEPTSPKLRCDTCFYFEESYYVDNGSLVNENKCTHSEHLNRRVSEKTRACRDHLTYSDVLNQMKLEWL